MREQTTNENNLIDVPVNRDADPNHQKDTAEIFLAEKKKQIKCGTYKVAEIKSLLDIPQEYELAEIKDDQIKYLPDNGTVEIDGAEVFAGNPKHGKIS
jgi:hypothetical protein